MPKLSDLRLSKNMKYTALYVAMRYFEHEPDIFEKTYEDGTCIKIDSANQRVYINGVKKFELNTHESFVKLECLDNYIQNRIVPINKIVIDDEKMIVDNMPVRFFVWDDEFNYDNPVPNLILYKSRLISGVLENECKYYHDGDWYDNFDGLTYSKNKVNTLSNPDFITNGSRLMKYIGKSKVVKIPEEISIIESCAFWDNQTIEEVLMHDYIFNIGGDTFYNCKNLKKINIPKFCSKMGNNPFAGCPDIEVRNDSSFFKMENGALYSNDKKTLIYVSIKGDESEFAVPEGVEIICKHAFFLCDRFSKITLPKSLLKMENNPFSGCSKLEIINNSKSYFIKDDVIYNGFKTSVVGTLNKIKSKRLVLLDGIRTINRNSFWNCKGIECIVFPESLNDIGYNPFVGCSNIHFESNSPYYKVVDGVLYNKDMSKIVCYPAWKAIGHVKLPDSVTTLERGAFSGCDKMTGLDLHNVNIVNKSCFTNCSSLKSLYCSDLITYVGEWAFAYCSSLEEVSVNVKAIVDNNAFSNCPAKLVKREIKTNYVIESENLSTLNSMKKAYKGKVDSILIDPPYNSHIDYIGYKDSGYEEGYHAFMKERIVLSKELLSDKGFLVINIDEGESINLFNICKDVFGEGLVSFHKWKKKHEFFDANRVVLNPNKKQTDFEYIIICRKSNNSQLKKVMQPYIEDGVVKERIAEVPETFDCFGTTSSAKDEICELFGRRDYFSTPKPLKLMKELVRMTTDKNSVVMDFFAGSGTVGHAVVDLNKEDGGTRTFILVSNSESNICKNVTVKRMEKSGAEFVLLD